MRAARLIVGALFCTTGALLWGMNCMAAVYAPNVRTWKTEIGKLGQAYEEVGHGLQIFGVVLFLLGVFYIMVSEGSPKRDS